MVFASKHTKVKPKGLIRELKIVQTVSRCGLDTIKAEEVKTPRRKSGKASSSSQLNPLSSPTKRPKLDAYDTKPIPFDLRGAEDDKKRQTLVFHLPFQFPTFSDNLKGQNDYLEQFLGHETCYLKHLLNLELPPKILKCTSCGCKDARFRCLDCFGPHWWCQGCLIKCHSNHPFHRPQEWKEGSFEKVSLCDLGYVLVLGHSGYGLQCPDEVNLFGDRRMTVIHVNGIFEHCVRFCRCQGAIPEHEQLFTHQLFPSTFERPETAFTLDVLDYYGIDAMECKTSAQSFFQKLRRVTKNAFPDELPVCLFLPYIYHQHLSDSQIKKESIHGVDQGQPPDGENSKHETFRSNIWGIVFSRKSNYLLPLLSTTWNKSASRLEESPHLGDSSNDHGRWKFSCRSYQDEKAGLGCDVEQW
jgi:hypothetical protein